MANIPKILGSNSTLDKTRRDSLENGWGNPAGRQPTESATPQFFDNRISKDLMTVEAVAAAFGKSPKTIRNWIAKRQIPAVKIGNRFMVRRRSLDAWLERKEIKPWQ